MYNGLCAGACTLNALSIELAGRIRDAGGRVYLFWAVGGDRSERRTFVLPHDKKEGKIEKENCRRFSLLNVRFTSLYILPSHYKVFSILKMSTYTSVLVTEKVSLKDTRKKYIS